MNPEFVFYWFQYRIRITADFFLRRAAMNARYFFGGEIPVLEIWLLKNEGLLFGSLSTNRVLTSSFAGRIFELAHERTKTNCCLNKLQILHYFVN